MSRERRRAGERGTAVTELVLSLSLIVFAMLYLIGMGYTLMNKQQALVGARFAAFYESGKGRAPTAAQARAAVSSPERWSLAQGSENDSGAARNERAGIIGFLADAFDRITGALGVDGKLTYTASTTPTRGLLPSLQRVRASERYTLARDTWTCEESGSYLKIFGRSLGLGSIPLPLELSCCETYPRR